MAAGNNEEEDPESLKNQLALAVRSLQWSYAIFWSISSQQPGVLEWGDGYYNGDIKTRKTVQAVDLDADQLGLQRSDQLRELYESLLAGESNPQARRPAAALSPEDLTDTEWYYLVCMSFVFNIGQGLPGRTLASNRTIWLCNAHCADSKVFSRSLLAKSASIQTVVCFPYSGGVVELGVTELVKEDSNLVQNMKTSFSDNRCKLISKISVYASESNRTDCVSTPFECNTNPKRVVECEEVNICSANNSSNGLEPKQQQAEESFNIEGINGAASQVQSWQIMDDEISNCFHNSFNSSDCISQTFLNFEKSIPLSYTEKVDDLLDTRDCDQAKLVSFDTQTEDMHYQNVLSTILKGSHQLISGPYSQNSYKDSSFVSWKNGETGTQMPQTSKSAQKLLKKVLFEVAKMHGGCSTESMNKGRKDACCRPETDGTDTNHVFAERRRREKFNERFSVLKSLVPSAGRGDKISILDHTIEHLKELKRRVEELESDKEATGLEARMEILDDAERESSDNYETNKVHSRRLMANKRKACDNNEREPEKNHSVLRNISSIDDVTVSVIERNVLIEVSCHWRECLLLEIMDAITNLHLDSHAIQSSNVDGIFSLTIRARLKKIKASSAGMIRLKLLKIVRS